LLTARASEPKRTPEALHVGVGNFEVALGEELSFDYVVHEGY
jgi:hypothetical protein